MDIEGNWARIKTHRARLSDRDVRGLAAVLFYDREDWLEEKLRSREDEALVIEFLGYLGQSGSLEAVRILLQQWDTHDEALLLAAAEALRKCPSILTLDPLIQILRQQNANAIKAGEVLLSYGREGADALWHLWYEENSAAGLKMQILQLMAESMDQRAEPLAYLAFLSEDDDLVRAALKAADKLDARILWGNVAYCLKHQDWKLRGRAARLLGRWEEKRALDSLREMGADPDPWVEEERRKAIAILDGDGEGDDG